MEEGLLETIRAGMREVRIASSGDMVYKDECLFSFATGHSVGGLYTNLATFQSFGDAFVDLDHERTGSRLYFHRKLTEVPIEVEEAKDTAPIKLAIGVEGGFQVGERKTRTEEDAALVVLPGRQRVPLPNIDIPQRVLDAIAAVQAQQSAASKEEVSSWQEEHRISKYASDLVQLPCQRKVPTDPAQWKCEETGVTENLWINLSTGFIGSGRPHWDGSGGNGAAMRHFEETGKKYPLVVKLGTINAGGADVYSYATDEDDMVEDPKLAEHLAHWGINAMLMERTEKTMAELQIEKNLSFESDRITEAGAELMPLRGPGYVGLANLGNSCYVNSIVQVLWSLPEAARDLLPASEALFRSAPENPALDLVTQWIKLGRALVEQRTGDLREDAGTGPVEASSVKPAMFRALVGKGHPEFSSNRQQDAEEYVGHLLEVLTRAGHAGAGRLADVGSADSLSLRRLFEFGLEDRIECSESRRVQYKGSPALTLGLSIPLEAATNRQELAERDLKRQKLAEEGGDIRAEDKEGERVLPRVPLAACLAAFAQEQTIEDYHSPALGRKTRASKCTRVASFPPYLLVQLRRYYVAEDWTPKKLEVAIDVPDRLTLEHLRALGPQPGEEAQPDEAEPAAARSEPAAAPEPDPTIVAQLQTMGFPEAKCRKAAAAVGGAGAEAAMEWLLGHLDEPDEPEGAAGATAGGPDQASVATLAGMGFTDVQASAALTTCGNSLERAADWLFSRMDDLDTAVAQVMQQAQAQGGTDASGDGALSPSQQRDDGPGEYELAALVSHIGSNTSSGHYVCHIRREGRWVLYNDDRVAVSANPPKDLAYLYLFRRLSATSE